MHTEPILVMSDEFSKEYEFYKHFEDFVLHKESEQIFKAFYENGLMYLLPVSNKTAMEKLEKGLGEFVLKLKKELELD
jgi:hypothetical protein